MKLPRVGGLVIIALSAVVLIAIGANSRNDSVLNVSASEADIVAAQTTVEPDTGIMVTNGVRHSVPLDEIVFDTFQRTNRALPYGAIPQDQIEDVVEFLRDRIAPLCEDRTDLIPLCLTREYETATAANDWLSGDSIVMGFVDNDGTAYSYPFKILNFHEIVNDTLAGEPLLISFCPLCNSAVVYSRILNGEELLFGNTSALYESDLVMYDHATDSYWQQVSGAAILGELTGRRLEHVPSSVSTWEQWRQTHPETLVLARPQTGIDYRNNPFANYADFYNRGGLQNSAFPVSEDAANDPRLPPATNVIVVEAGDQAIAYPLEVLGNAAVNDTVGGEEIVVLSLEEGPAGAAFSAQLEDGATVELEFNEGADAWRDRNSGSNFDLAGNALDGPLAGQKLTPLPQRFTFWFAAVASTPNIQVFQDD